MSKNKSLSDLVTDLQKENESLQSLKKLFEKACKNEFGYDVKTIHHIIEKQASYERRRAERQGQQNVFNTSADRGGSHYSGELQANS